MNAEQRRRERQRERKKAKRKEILEFFSDAGDFGDDDYSDDLTYEAPRPRRTNERRYPQERRASGRRKKKNHTASFIVVILLFVIAAGLVIAGIQIQKKYAYSKDEYDLNEYFHISGAEDVPLVLNDEVSSVRALQRGGYLYLPLSFVLSNINDRFFYDEAEHKLIYTTPEQVMLFPENSSEYTVGDQVLSASAPVWVMSQEEPYLETGFLAGYGDFILERFESPLRLQMYLQDTTVKEAVVKKDTQIRYQGGNKSAILTQISEGDSVTVLEELENWDKVKSADGLIGYTEKKFLSDLSDKQITIPRNYQPPIYPSLTRDHKINLVWHQVTNTTANEMVYDMLTSTKDVNVISPTWYYLSDDQGGFTTLADAGYVSRMHEKGIEVWALLENMTNGVDLRSVLGSYTNRQHLISNLIPSLLENGIDGLNVDIELLPQDTGEEYIEFLRELSVVCHANNLVLSVDNYVPTESSAHYRRRQQGEVVDYVIIMGYDEHSGASAEAGSCASLGFVLDGIEKTISEVPAGKVINALPFYTRLWRTSGSEATNETLSMAGESQAMEKRGITPQWDETTSQYYASFEEDGAICQVWLEEKESIRAKLKVMSQYDLGGVAAWRLGQETADVWDEIDAYLNGSLGNE